MLLRENPRPHKSHLYFLAFFDLVVGATTTTLFVLAVTAAAVLDDELGGPADVVDRFAASLVLF